MSVGGTGRLTIGAAWLGLALVVFAVAAPRTGAPGLYYDEAFLGQQAKDFFEPGRGLAHPGSTREVELFGRPFPLRNAVYLGEGLGHAFMALADHTVVNYLCSAPYAPGREHGVHPLDPALGIEWPAHDRDGRPITPVLSEKDAAAPGLDEVEALGVLPRFEDVRAFVADLRG